MSVTISLYENKLYKNLIEALDNEGIYNFNAIADTIFILYQKTK